MMSGSSDFKTPSEYRMGQNGHPDLILTTSDHLPSGQQWKPPHYLWISIGHPLEGPGMSIYTLERGGGERKVAGNQA